ncbi:MAG: hypothetical protein P4N59_22980 [Negativicutes bacterium]|nr:hypothetical protein [Negativicutes bacterium]
MTAERLVPFSWVVTSTPFQWFKFKEIIQVVDIAELPGTAV